MLILGLQYLFIFCGNLLFLLRILDIREIKIFVQWVIPIFENFLTNFIFLSTNEKFQRHLKFSFLGWKETHFFLHYEFFFLEFHKLNLNFFIFLLIIQLLHKSFIPQILLVNPSKLKVVPLRVTFKHHVVWIVNNSGSVKYK